MTPGVAGDPTLAAASSRTAFNDVAASLGVRLGQDALFAGTATSGTALASADDMMADIRTAMAGAATAADVAARLDTWFDDPAGGFATMAYLGNGTDMTRSIDADVSVTLSARADHAALRGVLKAAALGALAADPAVPLSRVEGERLVLRARDAALNQAAPLSHLRAGLGLEEQRVEETLARHSARSTAWGIMRNEMAAADPYATATEVEALRTQLETQYAITARLSSLSLASYLR
jgi:flagellar hook-associated protein 3 FlgL